MKNKTEIKLDKEFERMGVRPRIYHYMDVSPFIAITIVTDNIDLDWNDISKRIYTCSKRVFRFQHEHATRMLYELRWEGIFGVAICDKSNQFNRKRGREIAKGRLFKHLKEIQK